MSDRAARDAKLLRRGSCGRTRVGVCLTLAALGLACGDKSPPPSPKPFRGPGIGPVVQDPGDPLQRPRPAEPGPLLPAQTDLISARAAQPEPRAQAKQDEPRDYASELLQRLGNPASCLAQRTDDGKLAALSIGISAQLMPSGALARTELSASGLSGAERACLAQRVGAVRLPGPIDGAPFAIQASLTLQPSAAKPAPAAPAAAPTPGANGSGDPSQPREAPAFLEPSPEAKEVPAAPPIQFTGEGTAP